MIHMALMNEQTIVGWDFPEGPERTIVVPLTTEDKQVLMYDEEREEIKVAVIDTQPELVPPPLCRIVNID